MSLQPQKHPYNKDIVAWSAYQANLLRSHKIQEIDFENVAEEIESLGKSEKNELWSYVNRLLMHLLKKEYQPEKCSSSWIKSINQSLEKIYLCLKNSPSLKPLLKEYIEDSYRFSRRKASIETQLDIKTFPEKCPWSEKEILKMINGD